MLALIGLLMLVPDVALWLPRFYASLHALTRGAREQHVRVLWFGDSHTAADFWSHAVREPLQERFGVGGAGWMMPGLKYRHGLGHLSRTGKWTMIPRSPAATWLQGDGVLGLGGIGAIPISEDASAKISLSGAEWADGALTWRISYRPSKPTSSLRVQSGDRSQIFRAERGRERLSGLWEAVIVSEHVRELVLDGFVDAPELFGVIVEGDKPGLVLDTLGINGARVGTPLAWNAEAWVPEVKARQPDLIVLAYGTNEVGDPEPMSTYREQYLALLARLRLATPSAECLLVGPTDRVQKDWTSNPRGPSIDAAQRAVAREAGCAFFSAFDAMGGRGSLRVWAFGKPQLARRDRVHLLPSGYQKLGRELARQLIESYTTFYPDAEAAP